MRAAQRRQTPWALAAVLVAALCLHVALRLAADSAPPPKARDLPPAPALAALRLASIGETEAASKALMLHLQAQDDQPGARLPWREMDYSHLRDWLGRALELDSRSQYPLLAAAEVYSAVQDPQRVSQMLDFIHQRFAEDPDRRWPWLAYAALIAQHRLHDQLRARQYAAELRAHAHTAPRWAQELDALIAGPGELQATQRLAGAMLATGQVKTEADVHQLERILQATETRAAAQNGALR